MTTVELVAEADHGARVAPLLVPSLLGLPGTPAQAGQICPRLLPVPDRGTTLTSRDARVVPGAAVRSLNGLRRLESHGA